MSFFGHLLGGTVEGVGRGGAAEAEYRDKMELQTQLQRERALERQQLQDDRLAQQRELALMRAETARGNRRGSGGGGGGGSFFEMIEDIKTPEQAQRFIASVEAEAGPDAAAQAAKALGVSLTQTVNPTAGDFTRYDRSLNELGQSDMPAPASSTQAFSHDAEKGRIGLQRLLARASGKYKDFAEGEGQTLVNDAVRGAGADDGKLRTAGSIAMAVDGKQRFKVDGDQYVDGAGVVKPTQTDLGNAKAADERAGAAKKGAETAKVKDSPADPEVLRAVREQRISAKDQLEAARKMLKDHDTADKDLTTKARNDPARKAARETLAADVTKAQQRYEGIDKRLDDLLTAKVAKAEAKAPKADPKPAAGERKVGTTQIVQSGPNKGKTAVWDGKGWKLQ